jgi:Ca2+/H+ antiporter, TMEM165/GDT1 family
LTELERVRFDSVSALDPRADRSFTTDASLRRFDMRFGYVLVASYWTVLVAELIGDKSIFTVASLTLRFRAGLVFLAMVAAFGGKMLAAVLFGSLLTQLPAPVVTAASAIAFFGAGLFIWFRKPESQTPDPVSPPQWSHAALVAFASLFLSEWADPGQITTAAMVAHFHVPFATWLGGTLAMSTKGVLAMTIGARLRDRLPTHALRSVAFAACAILGVLTLAGYR